MNASIRPEYQAPQERTAVQLLAEWLETEEELSIVRAVKESVTTQSNIILHGQGIFDIATGRINKVEILARIFDKKDERILSPFAFLPFVKKSWRTADFDIGVLEKWLEYISTAPNLGTIHSINFYKSTLCDEVHQHSIHELLKFYKIQAGKIVFELLEDDVQQECPSQLSSTSPLRVFPMQRQQRIIYNEKLSAPEKMYDRRICPCEEMPHLILNESMRRIQAAFGIWFSVDDFPSGTNCMYNIYKMKWISYAKIDGIWLRNMLENFKTEFHESEWETKFLMEFHKILWEIRKIHPNIVFIVERVEDKELFDLFRQIPEIRYFQGYYFSKTKSIYDITWEIAEHNSTMLRQ